MKLLYYLNKPEYIFRPAQIVRRLIRINKRLKNEYEIALLPWDVKITIRPDEVLGNSILTTGIYDLSVTEVLYRLLERGETAIDVGANIGYMTSIMAKKVGSTGTVWAFEPHPELFEDLSANIRNWQKNMSWNQIKAQKLALSNKTGEGLLNVPQNFSQNRGIASLAAGDVNTLQTYYRVPLIKLGQMEEILEKKNQIGVLKVDVEGHELEVLEGAGELITKQQIRDVIFEEHRSYPSPVTQFLEKHGYTVFRIWKGFWKPLLEHPEHNSVHPWEPPSYLGTKDTLRAIERLKKPGWFSLSTTKLSK